MQAVFLSEQRLSSQRIILDLCPSGLALVCKTQHWRDAVTPGGCSMHLQLWCHFTFKSEKPGEKEQVTGSCCDFFSLMALDCHIHSLHFS